MSEMVERVAKALYEATPFKETEGGYDEQSEVYRRSCLLLARAAIKAMREPTDIMKRRVRENGGTQALVYALVAWSDMIDSSLEEGK